ELIRKENLKDTQIIARSEFQRISALLAQIPEKYTRQGLYLSLQISSQSDRSLLSIIFVAYQFEICYISCF
ncbi:hypothetical protein, partial [Nostoc sp. ChiSLP03a]|uniref:hypothetical protein n=1 Tax=Nostoc sp. ChiSLP03a TaxID=3075380 RepID=UPI002AD29004